MDKVAMPQSNPKQCQRRSAAGAVDSKASVDPSAQHCPERSAAEAAGANGAATRPVVAELDWDAVLTSLKDDGAASEGSDVPAPKKSSWLGWFLK
jgi:hypothetical protein